MKLRNTLMAAIGLAFAAGVHAQITVGVTVSATGPAASLGIPERNTIALMPQEIAGRKSITSFSTMHPIPPPRSRTSASWYPRTRSTSSLARRPAPTRWR
jgi:hypothetical protein